MENSQDKLVKLSIVAGLLIIVLSIGYYFIFNLPKQKTSQLQGQKPISEEDLKKQALIDFDKKITDAIINKDYTELYKLSNLSTKKYFTQEQFSTLKSSQDNQNVGRLVKISSTNIQITDKEGIIDRIYYTCLSEDDLAYKWLRDNPKDSRAEKVKAKLEEKGYSKKNKECSDSDIKENQQTIKYSYIKNSWQIYDPEPSERALKISGYFYNNISEERQKKMINNFGEGSDNYLLAIRNFAITLDYSPEAVADLEADIEKDKLEKSRPIVNVENPIQQPQSSWRDYLPSNNRINCTTNTIGSYTYTNCY